MSPRLRRLIADLNQMNELADRTPALQFRVEGDPPETYHLLINTPGVARDDDGRVALRRIHRCTVYLHTEYPRLPPVISWRTPILHPNILPPDRNGGVCIGSWSASESLADLVRRLIDLIAYRSFNADDALDKGAAAWVKEHGIKPGADLSAAVIDDGQSDEVTIKIAGRNSD